MWSVRQGEGRALPSRPRRGVPATVGRAGGGQALRAEADAIALAQEAARYDRAIDGMHGRRSCGAWQATGSSARDPDPPGMLLEQMNRLTDARAALEEARRASGRWGPRGRGRLHGRARAGAHRARDPRAGLALLEEAWRSGGPRSEPAVEGSILNDMAVALGNLGDFPGPSPATPRRWRWPARTATSGAGLVLKNRAATTRPRRVGWALFDFRESGRRSTGWGTPARRARPSTRQASPSATSAPGGGWRVPASTRLLQKAGDLRFVAFTLNHMGLLRLEQGRYPEARRSSSKPWPRSSPVATAALP